jgi:hypothetical protein
MAKPVLSESQICINSFHVIKTTTFLQVSHHPQVSALHATDQKGNIEIILCHSPLPKFVGKQTSPYSYVMLCDKIKQIASIVSKVNVYFFLIFFYIIKNEYVVNKLGKTKKYKCVGTGVEVDMHGKRKLHLHNHGETYEMNCPNFLFRFLPIPGIDWVGNVTIRCLETGLVAELSYIRQSFFGFGSENRRRIKGKIFDSSTKNVLYKVDGHWDRYIS